MTKNNLKKIRENKGLSKLKLSKLSGIDDSNLSKIENR